MQKNPKHHPSYIFMSMMSTLNKIGVVDNKYFFSLDTGIYRFIDLYWRNP